MYSICSFHAEVELFIVTFSNREFSTDKSSSTAIRSANPAGRLMSVSSLVEESVSNITNPQRVYLKESKIYFVSFQTSFTLENCFMYQVSGQPLPLYLPLSLSLPFPTLSLPHPSPFSPSSSTQLSSISWAFINAISKFSLGNSPITLSEHWMNRKYDWLVVSFSNMEKDFLK